MEIRAAEVICSMTPKPGGFQINVTQTAGGVHVLRLDGQLTIRTLLDLQDQLPKHFTGPVIVDIGGVTYMDSAGLGCLLSLYNACQRSQSPFALAGISDRVRTLLKVTHVDHLLRSYPDVAQAELALTGPQP
jgi:anti-sigma B factor antagonist